MITPRLYETLDEEEKALWHSHDYEVNAVAFPHSLSQDGKTRILSDFPKVRSGMLILPNPNVPEALWEIAETKEMKEVIGLYGKTFHFWQIDRGDSLPLGMPELMMSFTNSTQVY